jgi:small-conductance mechanosensitive channel
MSSMSNQLKDIAKRAETWPEKAREKLVRAALDIEDEYVSPGHSAEEHEKRIRTRAWEQLNQLFERMRSLNPGAAESPDEIRAEEERISEDIRSMRRQQRHA